MAFLCATPVSAPHNTRPTNSRAPRPRTVCAAAPEGCPRHARRTVLHALAAVALHATLPRGAARGASPAQQQERARAQQAGAIVQSTRVLNAVPRYIDAGAWDKGRTSVNYCTRVLALRRNMRAVAERLDGDAFYDGLALMDDVANALSQLDASLYTPLFIPADDGEISLEQRRYQLQAREFFAIARDGLAAFVKLLPPDELERATAAADRAKYEIELEFE